MKDVATWRRGDVEAKLEICRHGFWGSVVAKLNAMPVTVVDVYCSWELQMEATGPDTRCAKLLSAKFVKCTFGS